VKEFFRTHAINLFYLDSYLDTEDFNTPVKHQINMPYFSYLTTSQEEKTDIFVKERLVVKDNTLLKEESVHFKVGEKETRTRTRLEKTDSYFSFVFRLSDRQIKNRILGYGMLAWLAEIGGLAKTVFFVAGICVLILQKPLLKRELFNRLYLVKKSDEEVKAKFIKNSVKLRTKMEMQDHNTIAPNEGKFRRLYTKEYTGDELVKQMIKTQI